MLTRWLLESATVCFLEAKDFGNAAEVAREWSAAAPQKPAPYPRRTSVTSERSGLESPACPNCGEEPMARHTHAPGDIHSPPNEQRTATPHAG